MTAHGISIRKYFLSMYASIQLLLNIIVVTSNAVYCNDYDH